MFCPINLHPSLKCSSWKDTQVLRLPKFPYQDSDTSHNHNPVHGCLLSLLYTFPFLKKKNKSDFIIKLDKMMGLILLQLTIKLLPLPRQSSSQKHFFPSAISLSSSTSSPETILMRHLQEKENWRLLVCLSFSTPSSTGTYQINED